MNQVTVREIIEYARGIEAESHAFYRAAAEVLKDPEALEAAGELAMEEEKHFQRLSRLLESEGGLAETLDQRIQTGVNLSSRVVPTMNITPESTPGEILRVALQREERTRDQYRTFISMTGSDPKVIELFSELVEQEEGHARRVRLLLDRLEG